MLYSESELNKVAQLILSKGFQTIAFFGEMGAGKTTLIKEICFQMKVFDAVSSPTYAIINEYATENNDTIVHMDWYRLKDEEDARNAGVEIYLQNKQICLIEWPERAMDLLPNNTLCVYINVHDETKRSVELKTRT